MHFIKSLYPLRRTNQDRAGMAHSTLMQRLLSLTKLAHQSNKQKIAAAELAEEQMYSRRKFLHTSGKAAIAATVLAACNKAVNKPVTNNYASQPTIAIIGAGIAGLHAAHILRKQNVAATVYDASSRAGGRIFTAQSVLNSDLSTELGGEFIDSDHHDMRNLAAEFGFPLLNLYTHSELKLKQNLYYFNGISYTDDDFVNAITPYLTRINKDINSLSDVIKYNSYSATDKKFDNMNLEQYFDSINLHGWIRSLLLVAYLGEYGLNTWECNAINFLFLFGTSPEGSLALYGSSDERYKVSGGNQKIVDALADELKDSIRTNYKLVQIQGKDKGYQLYFDGISNAVNADIVLLTLPFKVLREVDIKVDLPEVKRNAINHLGYGFNSKLILGFNGRPWRTKFNSVGMSYADNGTQNTWDNSQLQQGLNGGLTIFLGGNDAVNLGTGSVASQAAKYIDKIDQMYPGIKSDYNNKAFRMDWQSYPYAKCGYSAWTVGQYTTVAGSEFEAVGNLYFAGEHTSYNYQGYMNGGAITGRRAAENILKAID